MAAEEARALTSRAFGAYGRTLEIVPPFKYLGIVVLAAEDHWKEVIQNLAKARTVLGGNVKDPYQGGGKAAGVRIFL